MSETSEKSAESKKKHNCPLLAVDIGVVRMNGSKREVLLIRRDKKKGEDACGGMLAFPGGFVNNNEDPLKAVERELNEETQLDGKNPKLVGVYGDPKRDKRQHVVSLFYYVEVENTYNLKAGDDAVEADWYPIKNIGEVLAFDHNQLLNDLAKFLDNQEKQESH